MERRSILFSPGDDSEKMRKALGTDADAVALDLEDAVASSAKNRARRAVADVLAKANGTTEVAVRINPLDDGGRDDIAAISSGDADPDAVVLPKAESANVTHELGEVLDSHGSSADVFAVIETAAGILSAPEIAEAARVDALIFGAEDFTADIGTGRTDDGEEIMYARQRTVVAAAAAGISAIDTVFTDIKDLEGLRTDAERAVQYGFDGKLAIHPAQIDPIYDAFVPDTEQVEWARKVLESAREANSAGKSVFEVDGQMIDPPLIGRARRIAELTDQEL